MWIECFWGQINIRYLNFVKKRPMSNPLSRLVTLKRGRLFFSKPEAQI